jgi:hypothetical protein
MSDSHKDNAMTERHQTKDKGDLAVAKTILNLRKHGIHVCLPISEHLPFDLIAVMPDMQTLRRVQVKYRTDTGTGTLEVKLRGHYYNSKHIYSKPINREEIDCYSVYSPETRETYYINIKEISESVKAVKIRFIPAKSNRKKDVWTASDYVNPTRIAPICENAAPCRREVSELDEIAIAYVTADLMEKGVQVIIPQSQFVPFDLIGVMQNMKTMHRIRVGYEQVCITSNVDQYAIFDPITETITYIAAQQVPYDIPILTLEGVAG